MSATKIVGDDDEEYVDEEGFVAERRAEMRLVGVHVTDSDDDEEDEDEEEEEEEAEVPVRTATQNTHGAANYGGPVSAPTELNPEDVESDVDDGEWVSVAVPVVQDRTKKQEPLPGFSASTMVQGILDDLNDYESQQQLYTRGRQQLAE
ncbi:hypothetical protein Pelo_15604 [Pelomyxa schiedti]|nr:hypothetical protein Pelo_15604 [Pelomyxa schiedti]